MKKKFFVGISYLYVLLPIALFFIGWVKLWISIPLCILLFYTFIKAVSIDIDLWFPKWNHTNVIKGIIIIFIIAIWTFFSGIGNFVWQNFDHSARNALYEILVSNEWPVIKSVVCEDGLQIRGLIYYIGYWLPAAVIGKAFGVSAGYCFQYIWAIFGISLGVIFINSFLEKWAVWPVVLFIMFSGLDAVGCVLNNKLDLVVSYEHLEWWTGFQFSSFTTQLYWVFNQAIYAWILLALIVAQKTSRHVICIWSLGLLECTFPFVGMFPFVVYVIFRNIKAEYNTNTLNRYNGVIRELFTVENVFCGGIVGLVSAMYLFGNVSVQKSTVPINYTDYSIYYFSMYVLFIIIEIGIYYLYVCRYYKNNPLFYISLIILLICPFVKIGSGGDFCMRASIPSLVILFFMVAKSFKEDIVQKKCIYCWSLMVILAIGSITVIHEMGRVINHTIVQYQENNEVINITLSEERILQGNNFSGQIDNNLFFKYLAK